MSKGTRLSRNIKKTEEMKKEIEREDFEEAWIYPIGFYIYWKIRFGQLRGTGVRT